MRKNRRGTDLTPSEKNEIAQILFANSTNGAVHRGKLDEISASFGVHRRTAQYVWQAAKQQQSVGGLINFKNGKSGLEHNITSKVSLDKDAMMAISYDKRGTMRTLARELKISKSTICRWVKAGEIKPHTNAIKSAITPANMIQRLRFSLNELEVDSLWPYKITFKTMHNVIHIDEKWFYMTRATERSYKLPIEAAPYRACKSKKFIPKVMFMSAIARPLFNAYGSVLFDGKIGLFPFTKREPAQRNSRNRIRGTMTTKPIDSVTKLVIKNYLINQIIPAIKAKWPAHASKNIIIQQDNARPHINNNDPEFRAAASSDSFNIQLVYQPPNSPDLNINDVGYFRSIQALQIDTASYSVDQLLTNVMKSYDKMEPYAINKVFLSLQTNMIDIMKLKGHNDYEQQHMGKDSLARAGRLPLTLEVDEHLVREYIDYLQQDGHLEGAPISLGLLMSGLGYD